MMNPWLGFINSDGAVPFQVVLEPWRAQDLYYWQTTRMGMLYEVLWKAVLSLLGLRESLVGNPHYPEMFYLGHVILYFVGLALWSLSLKRRMGQIIFFLFFLPLTHGAMDWNLTPGQPYGIVFFLGGAFFWTLVKLEESNAKHALLASLLGMFYIQHELGFLIMLSVYVARYLHHLKDFGQRPFRAFAFILVLWVGVGLYFKARSKEWIGPSLDEHSLVTLKQFLTNVWDNLRYGTWSYAISRGSGHLFTFAVVGGLIEYGLNQRKAPFFRSVGQTLLLGSLVAFLLIHLSGWYVLNGRDTRYFTFLTPYFIYAFLLRLEKFPSANVKKARPMEFVALLACAIPIWIQQDPQQWVNPIIRSQLTTPTRPVRFKSVLCHMDEIDRMLPSSWHNTWLPELFPVWGKEACRLLSEEYFSSLSRAVTEAGCAGYIDQYWFSHILAAASAGRIITSAGNHIRNPELMDRVRRARPLCVMPRNGYAFQNFTSGLDCKKSTQEFLICDDIVK